MIELLGYFCTACTLLGVFLNARKIRIGFLAWIVGDIGWIIYSLFTHTYAHGVLCVTIIFLNVYGYYHWGKEETKS